MREIKHSLPLRLSTTMRKSIPLVTCSTMGEHYGLTTTEINAVVKTVEENIKRRLQCKYFEDLQRIYGLRE